MQNDMGLGLDKRTLLWIKRGVVVVVALIIIVAINPFVIIGPGERGVVTRLGAIQDGIKNEGLNFKIPLIENVIVVDVKIRKKETKATAASKDLQNVSTEITLNYSLNPVSVNKLWQEIGPDFEYRVVDPAIQESLKAVTARFTAEELIQRRPEVKSQIHEMLDERLKGKYLIVDAVSITAFDFSSGFNAAIEAKQQAEQLALKAERDLERIKTEAKQQIARAQAKAESLRLQKMQVTPQLIQLKQIDAEMAAIEKWNGVLPQYTGGGAIPFINVTSK